MPKKHLLPDNPISEEEKIKPILPKGVETIFVQMDVEIAVIKSE